MVKVFRLLKRPDYSGPFPFNLYSNRGTHRDLRGNFVSAMLVVYLPYLFSSRVGKVSEYQEAVEDLRGAAQQATEGASQCVQQDSHTR